MRNTDFDKREGRHRLSGKDRPSVLELLAMIDTADAVTFSVPRDVLSEIVKLSADLTDRMHELLERNTDGALAPHERAELKTLTQVAQFGEIVSLVLSR